MTAASQTQPLDPSDKRERRRRRVESKQAALRNKHTVTQVALMLNVDEKTLSSLMTKAGIEAEVPEWDRRMKLLSDAQIKTLRAVLGGSRPNIVSRVKTPLSDLWTQVRQLLACVSNLERRADALERGRDEFVRLADLEQLVHQMISTDDHELAVLIHEQKDRLDSWKQLANQLSAAAAQIGVLTEGSGNPRNLGEGDNSPDN